MGLLDVFLGPRCDMCGQRKDDVGRRAGTTLRVCTSCNRSRKRSDAGKPPGAAATRYRPGQPPKIAGPMGGRYVGPAAKDQRRR